MSASSKTPFTSEGLVLGGGATTFGAFEQATRFDRPVTPTTSAVGTAVLANDKPETMRGASCCGSKSNIAHRLDKMAS